jgi:hypothetical protein
MNDAGLTEMSHMDLGRVIREGSVEGYQEVHTIFEQQPGIF